jgi:hypothetical protein
MRVVGCGEWAVALATLTYQRNVLTAAFSPDGKRVVTASEDNTTRVSS